MSAVVLEMPKAVQRRAKRRLDRVELEARHGWMMENFKKWETTELDGVEYLDATTQMLMDAMRKAWADEFPPLTAAGMRKSISDGRKVIAKRNQIKAYLEHRGVDLSNIHSAEDALFALFELADA